MKLHPDIPEAHHNIADIMYVEKNFKGAMKASKRAISLRPTMTHSTIMWVLCLEGLGRLHEALAAAEEALDDGIHGDGEFRLMYHRARLLRGLGRLKESKTAFRTCLEADGGDEQGMSFAHNEYAHLLTQMGDEAESAKHFR